jgi:tripartite-type tricarboxylate transporter receptor subunit TctC
VLAAGAAGLLASPPLARAQAWPSRPVTIVLPFAPGSGTDLLARAVAQHFSETQGQRFIVENRPGAGGNVGAAAVARATPNGYTLLFGTPGPLANNKLIFKNLGFDPEQAFAPIVLIAKSPLVVAARTSLPVGNIRELAAYARANSAQFTAGVPGNGTLGHIAALFLQRELGLNMTIVPYRGSSEVVNDLMGGQIDLAVDFLPSYVPGAQAGQLRALAVTTVQRSSDLPEVETVQEGGVQGFEASAWYALAAPTGTPVEIIDRLNTGTNAFLQSPAGKAALARLSMQSVGGSPADLRDFISAELRRWGPVIRDANISM